VAYVPPASSKIADETAASTVRFLFCELLGYHTRDGSSLLWQRFQNYFLRYDDLDFSIDISRMKFPDDFFDKMKPRIGKAFRMSESPPVMSGLTTNSHSRNSG
jgi:hypothetical protein